MIIALVSDSVKEALEKRGVIVTKVQVVVPAAIFNRFSRVSVEARRVTVTVCDDGEREAAWRVLEEPGPGVLLNLGTTSTGAWLERVVGTPRRLSWCLTAHLEGEERPSWVKGRIQAVMQSAGMGPAELVEVGQAGVDAFAPWVQFLLPEEAGMYPFFRKTTEDGVFQVMTSEYFAGGVQRYLRLRYDETNPAAGSRFVLKRALLRKSCAGDALMSL